MHFTGTGVALITPFTLEGKVDYNALRKLVEFVIAGGVDYLVVLGTTAESVTLNSDEKVEIMRTVADVASERVPLVVGIGGNNTQTVADTLQNTNLEGYSAVLSVSPYYNRPTQEGIYRHFKALSAVSPLPVILYNVPARTGSNVLPDTVIRLARECENIIGIKEASGDLDQIKTLIQMVPPEFLVISGDDLTAVPTVLEGGAGVISVMGQGIPEVFTRMILQARDGRRDQALKLHRQLEPLAELLFQEGNPAGIKSLLHAQGICDTHVRLPLVAPSTALNLALADFLAHRLPVPDDVK